MLTQVVADETSVPFYIAKYISKVEPVEMRRKISEYIVRANQISDETA